MLSEPKLDVPTAPGDSLCVSPAQAVRQHLLRELPSALLMLLALAQIGLAFGAGLSPWKGGGFGMFATNDHDAFRTLRIRAIGPEGEHRLALPSDLQRAALGARALPREAALRRLARALAPEAPRAREIRVEVWQTEFDVDLHPSFRKLAAGVWRRAP